MLSRPVQELGFQRASPLPASRRLLFQQAPSLVTLLAEIAGLYLYCLRSRRFRPCCGYYCTVTSCFHVHWHSVYPWHCSDCHGLLKSTLARSSCCLELKRSFSLLDSAASYSCLLPACSIRTDRSSYARLLLSLCSSLLQLDWAAQVNCSRFVDLRSCCTGRGPAPLGCPA